jgi:hypothetical protein
VSRHCVALRAAKISVTAGLKCASNGLIPTEFAARPKVGQNWNRLHLVNKGKLVSRSLAISAPADTKQPPQLGNGRLTFPRRRAVKQIANSDRDVREVVAAWIKLSRPGA